MLQSSRPLKPELYYEMQKSLPLPNAINILKNLSSREIVDYNAPKIIRNVRRLKTSLQEYIQSNALPVYNDEDDDADYDMENNRMWINNDIEWKPEFDALLRYGHWMTSIRPFEMDSGHFIVVGIPENFIGELLLHMANSSSTKLMLQSVKMNFENAKFPTFLEPLFDKKENQIGNRILFDPVELKAEDGRIFHIIDWEFREEGYPIRECFLDLFVVNQMDKSWFKIAIKFDDSMKFIRQLEFSRWNMQNDIIEFLGNNEYEEFKQNGNKLEAEREELYCYPNLDLFIRRGANFTQFRHFEVKGPGKIGHHKQMVYPYCLSTAEYDCHYADFLVNYVSKTKYPEDFLESIDINFGYDRTDDMIIDEIAAICYGDIPEPKRKFIFPEGGKIIEFGKDKFLIVSATIIDFYNFQFTLANGPTNGAYEFDIDVHFEWPCAFQEKIGGIEIRKRKVLGIIELQLENDKLKEEISKLKEENEALKANKSQNGNIVELKCSGQIELGKKRKESSNDGKEDDGPTCSSKIHKK